MHRTPFRGDGPVLVVQTAFPGDVVLVTPLLDALREHWPASPVDVVVTPVSAPLLRTHPSVRETIIYDKHGVDGGFGGVMRCAARLRSGEYGLALIPHRSIRSALLGSLAGIPRRYGFDRSAGRFFFTTVVRYDPGAHEIDRNLSLLAAVTGEPVAPRAPTLCPSAEDEAAAADLLAASGAANARALVGIAPGSIWATKRWPEESYAALAKRLAENGIRPVLLGSEADRSLAERVARGAGEGAAVVAAGRLSLAASAALIGRLAALVCNDSAPAHLGSAMGTPVVAIFGPTVPAFGFAPRGEGDRVVEKEMSCRPCSIHGGRRCPLGTHACMKEIGVDEVWEALQGILLS